MQNKIFIVSIILIAILSRSVSALEPVVVSDEKGKYNLSLYLETLEDKYDTYNINDFLDPANDFNFKPNFDRTLNFGFTRSAYWVRLSIKNEITSRSPLVLQSQFANTHFIDFYMVSQDGDIIKSEKTGVLRPLETRDHKYQQIVFYLNIPSGSENTIYMKFRSESSLTIPLYLWSMTDFMNHVQNNNLIIGIYFGLLLIMILYNFLLYFSLRQNNFLYFASFIISIAFFAVCYVGIGPVYLWPNFLWWNKISIPLSNALIIITFMKFTNAFLFSENGKNLWKLIIKKTCIAAAILFILTFFIGYYYVIMPLLVLIVFSFIFALTAGFKSWLDGFHPAGYYLTSMVILSLVAVSMALIRFDILPDKTTNINIYIFSTSLFVWLMSQAVADRVKLLQIEKEQADESLIKSEQKFKQLFTDLPDAIILTKLGGDNAGEIIDVNPATEKQTGYSRSELIGMNLFDDLLANKYEENEIAFNEKQLINGESIRLIEQKIRKDGTLFWTQVVVNALDTGSEKVSLSVNRDITEQIESEEKIRILSRSLEQSPVSIIITDLNFNIEYTNPKFTESTGYKAEEVIGKKMDTIYSGIELSEIASKLKSQNEWHAEHYSSRKDGTKFWEFIYMSSIKNEQGLMTHHVSVNEDITEIKKLQQQLLQAQKMESIGTLAGGIAHDFNNILTVIKGYSEFVLLNMKKDQPLYNEIEAIFEAGEKAENLTRQILAFSRKQLFQPKIININHVLSDLKKMIQRLIGEDIKIEMLLHENIDYIKADPHQIEQIIINIVVNARDAIYKNKKQKADKKITIKTDNIFLDKKFAETNPGSQVGHHIYIEIEDTGHGMDEHIQKKVFDPFFTTKDKGEGTGLGLSMVYGIVKQNNGCIFVNSNPGQGTSFKIYWPVTQEEIPHTQKSKTDNLDLQGDKSILFVEDDQQVRDFTATALKDFGYRVTVAENGEKALQLLKKNKYKIELIITDIIMPGIGGKELVNRALKYDQNIKILYTSGYSDSQIYQGKKNEKNIEFLQKPYSVINLLRKIKDIFQS